MSDYIPVKKLSVEDQERLYGDLMSWKPVQVKADPGNYPLEDRLKQKEAIEKKHRIRKNRNIGMVVGSFLVFLGAAFFTMNNDKFAPYRKDPIVVEYLDKKQKLRSLEYEKNKLIRGTEYTLEKILGDAAKRDRVVNLQKIINMLQSDVKEKEGKKEVVDYNSFFDRTFYILLLGFLTACLGCIGPVIRSDKNDKEKEQELKALGF